MRELPRLPNYNDFIHRLYPGVADRSLVREVTFQVTNQCNLRCDYYGYFKNSDSTHIKAKLNVETIFAVAKRNVSFYTLVNHQKGPIAA